MRLIYKAGADAAEESKHETSISAAGPEPGFPWPHLSSPPWHKASSLALAGMRLGILIGASPALPSRGALDVATCNVPTPQVSWIQMLPRDKKDQV